MTAKLLDNTNIALKIFRISPQNSLKNEHLNKKNSDQNLNLNFENLVESDENLQFK